MLGGLGTTEIIIIAVVIMVLFGAKRLPDAARSLGRSARILKAETKGLHDDDEASKTTTTAAEAPQVAPPAPRFDPHTGAPLDPQAVRPADGTDRQP